MLCKSFRIIIFLLLLGSANGFGSEVPANWSTKFSFVKEIEGKITSAVHQMSLECRDGEKFCTLVELVLNDCRSDMFYPKVFVRDSEGIFDSDKVRVFKDKTYRNFYHVKFSRGSAVLGDESVHILIELKCKASLKEYCSAEVKRLRGGTFRSSNEPKKIFSSKFKLLPPLTERKLDCPALLD